MKKNIVIALFIFVCIILDNAVMPFCAVNGYYPSTAFVFIICYSILSERYECITIGILVGFFQDIYFLNGLGINMLLNMLMCLLACEVGKNIFKDKFLIPVATVFATSLIKGGATFVIIYILGIRTHISTALYLSIYNMIISILIYKIVYSVYKKDFMQRQWKF